MDGKTQLRYGSLNLELMGGDTAVLGDESDTKIPRDIDFVIGTWQGTPALCVLYSQLLLTEVEMSPALC
jgi:hypothetical protein